MNISGGAAATEERRDAAGQATSEIDSQIQEQETQAQSLAQQLQTWEQLHRNARQLAVEETRAKVEGEDLTVTAVHTA